MGTNLRITTHVDQHKYKCSIQIFRTSTTILSVSINILETNLVKIQLFFTITGPKQRHF